MDNNPNEELNTQPEVPEITTGESNEPVINTEPQPVVEPTPVVESTPVPVQPVENPAEEPKKKGHGLVFALIALILVIVIGVVIGLKVMNKKEEPVKEKETKKEIPASPYQISGYDIGAFDLYFLQLENTKKNKVYSPLSIKYTLTMLNEGTDGDSHDQIKSVVGDYSAKKYTNNNNMSFANALFVKNSYKDGIKKEYVETLKTKYDAEVGYDSFATPTVVNSWISNKTFKLINNMLDDISNQDFILVNALAIDMQWVHQIDTDGNRKDDKFKSYIWTEYTHRDFQKTFLDLQNTDYTELKFEGVNYKVQAVPIAAVANKYDVIATVGEDNIRKTVTAEYKKWLDAGAEGSCVNAEVGEKDPAPEVYIETYMKELGEHYKDLQYTTDFLFYVNDDVKVFAKDLKKYGDTTLQYVGIMPTKIALDEYIKNVKAEDITTLIKNLKSVSDLNSYKDGYVTDLNGEIPMFNMEYELKLVEDLQKLGITDIFDTNKANLTKITTAQGAHINSASHKAKIEFSNDGIKAAAASTIGGAGSGACGFDYLYKMPIEKIDLTFNKPYLFIIRDKDSGEVWFTGTVYEPAKWKSIENMKK